MEKAFPSTDNLESVAQYRPGVASRIANLLTGGLYGMASGTTQRSVDAERARQALFQENLQNRLMQRRRMEQLLEGAQQAGISSEESATLINDPTQLYNRINEMRMRESLAKETGRQMGVSGDQGPIQTQTPQESRAFGIGMAEGQADQFNKNLQLSRLKQSAQSLGIQISDQDTEESIRAKIGQQSAEASQKKSYELSQKSKVEEAVAGLKLAGKTVPTNDQEAVALWNQTKAEAPTRSQLAKEKALDNFNEAVASGEQQKIDRTFNLLTVDQKRDLNNRRAAGRKPEITEKQYNELVDLADVYTNAANSAESIGLLVGAKNVPEISRLSFNSLQSAIRDKSSKFFTQGDNDFKIQRVIQELSDLAAGKRNDLFGASLTPQELLESKALFYDRNSANFLPQALSFIDRIFSKDKFQYYEDRYDIDEKLRNKVQEARDTWSGMRNSFKGWEAPSSAKEKLSKSGLKTNAPAAGGTNAPAAGKTTSGKGFKIISE
jgi:hypothetical protein